MQGVQNSIESGRTARIFNWNLEYAPLVDSLLNQGVIGAREANQGSAIMAGHRRYSSDQDLMVPARIRALDVALHSGQNIRQKRHPTRAMAPVESLKPVLRLISESCREPLLMGSQNIQTESARLNEIFENGAPFVETDQNQRRLQGNRCERTHGHSYRSTI
jgi:hypothetical protein